MKDGTTQTVDGVELQQSIIAEARFFIHNSDVPSLAKDLACLSEHSTGRSVTTYLPFAGENISHVKKHFLEYIKNNAKKIRHELAKREKINDQQLGLF